MNRLIRYSLLAFVSLLAIPSDVAALQPQIGPNDPLRPRQQYSSSSVETSTITVTHTETACTCGTGSLPTKSTTLTSIMAGSTTTKTSTTHIIQTIYYNPSSITGSTVSNGGLTAGTTNNTGCPISSASGSMPTAGLGGNSNGTCVLHSSTSYSNFTLPLTTTVLCPTGTSAVDPIATTTTTHGTIHDGSSSAASSGYSSTYYSSSPASTHIPVPTGGGTMETVPSGSMMVAFLLFPVVMSLA